MATATVLCIYRVVCKLYTSIRMINNAQTAAAAVVVVSRLLLLLLLLPSVHYYALFIVYFNNLRTTVGTDYVQSLSNRAFKSYLQVPTAWLITRHTYVHRYITFNLPTKEILDKNSRWYISLINFYIDRHSQLIYGYSSVTVQNYVTPVCDLQGSCDSIL